VSAATAAKEKVYQYEPNGVGGCHSEGGCVGLLSSGTSEHEAAFLDASVSGNDVFFLTASRLVGQDVDGSFDVYDAHVCEPASPCLPPPASPPSPCEGEGCQASSLPAPTFLAGGSATFSGPGNTTSHVNVLGAKEVAKPKPLTRAQQLAKALKACRKHKQKSKRLACESQARKKYGPKKHTNAKKGAGTGKRR
jgi:hypothetical protein